MTVLANAYYLDDLVLGMSCQRTFKVTEALIMGFADVSGDHNPVHVDETYAQTTSFKGRIAHGMLIGAFISATMASDLPGQGSIYVAQNLKFKRPVRINDEVTIEIKITRIDLKSAHVWLSTTARVNNKIVTDGEAEIVAPKKPSSDLT